MLPKPISEHTAKVLAARWVYNPSSGEIRWRDGLQAGKPVSRFANRNGLERTQMKINGKVQTFTYARVCWFLYYGEDAEAMLDHVNMDKSDHRIGNLRPASKSTNGMNRPGIIGRKHDLPKNVYTHRDGRLRASVRVAGKTISGGVHDTVEAAADAAQKLRETHHKEYAHG